MSTWKKAVGLGVIALGLMFVGTKKAGAVATTQDILVTVTVDLISVSVGSATWDIGTGVSVSDVRISSRIPVTNDGNVLETYSLSINDGGSVWDNNDAIDTVGTDVYAMLALFTTTSIGSLLDSHFSADAGDTDDLITTGGTAATASNFARAAEDTTVKGLSIPTTEVRSLYLNFRSPSTNTQSAEQNMTVTVTAAAS